jgi:hypothetical protein
LELPLFQSSLVPAADEALSRKVYVENSLRAIQLLNLPTAFTMSSRRPNLTGFDHYKFIQSAGSPANDPWARKCV